MKTSLKVTFLCTDIDVWVRSYAQYININPGYLIFNSSTSYSSNQLPMSKSINIQQFQGRGGWTAPPLPWNLTIVAYVTDIQGLDPLFAGLNTSPAAGQQVLLTHIQSWLQMLYMYLMYQIGVLAVFLDPFACIFNRCVACTCTMTVIVWNHAFLWCNMGRLSMDCYLFLADTLQKWSASCGYYRWSRRR